MRRRVYTLLFCLTLSLCCYFYIPILIRSFSEYEPAPTPKIENGAYTGRIIDPLPEDRQQDKNSCGHAALAFLLNYYGIETNEKTIVHATGKEGNLTFYEMAEYIKSINLKYKAYEVNAELFYKHGEPCIMHVSWGHFIVFLSFIKPGYCLLFDPSRGLVLIDRQTLKAIWDGYVLYVYS